MAKTKVIALGTNAELLRKLVDVLYEEGRHGEKNMTKNPSRRKTWLPSKKAKRLLNEANLSAWKIMKRNAACELPCSIIPTCKKTIRPI